MPTEYCAQRWSALRRRTKLLRLRFTIQMRILLRAWFIIGIATFVVSSPRISQAAPLVGGIAAEAAFAAGKYSEALPYFQGVLQNKLSSDKELAVANCRVGIINSIQGNNVTARKHLEVSLEAKILSGKPHSICSYALLQVYAIVGAYPEAQKFVRVMGDLNLPFAYKARAAALASEVGRKLNNNAFLAEHLARLLQIMDENKMLEVEVKVIGKTFARQSVLEQLGLARAAAKNASENVDDGLSSPFVLSGKKAMNGDGNLQPIAGSNAAEGSFKPSRTVPLPDDLTFLRSMREGNYEEVSSAARNKFAEVTGESALSKYALSSRLLNLQERYSRLTKMGPKRLRVGVVVTSGSSYARYKHKILRSLSAFASSQAAKGVNISFVVRAVANEMGNIEDTVLSLLLEEGVHAVIGTLTGNQALAALSVCEQFSVPLFSIGPVANAPELRAKNHVRMGVLAASQANTHVEHLKGLNLQTTAVMAPNDTYGVEMAAAFKDAAAEQELKVVSVTFFDINKQNFQDPVQVVLGPQGHLVYRDEYELLAKELREKAEKEKGGVACHFRQDNSSVGGQ